MNDTMSGTNFGNMWEDPTMMGLLGAAGAFGQAAMPSRMPIPMGAALGLAAGGLAQGARGAYATQLAQQQAEAAKIANQRANLLMGYFGNQFGGGSGNPAIGSGGPGAPMGAPSGGGGDTNSGYLLPPTKMLSLGDLAMMTGQDRAASALYGLLGSTAGGPGYAFAPNGNAGAVPGGPHDPRVIARNTYAAEVPKANVGLWEAYNKPGELPGGGYGTPGQLIGPPPQIGGGVPGAPATGASAATGGAVPQDPFPTIAARINGAENPTGNPGATNPQSSAAGNGQFLNGTWPNVIRAARPDIAAGRSDADLMALRNNPGVALDATTTYARQNAAALGQSGFPVTPGTIYMAHGLGPAGAMAVLRATPQTPVAAVLPSNVIAANPYLQGKTAGDVRQYFDQKMSGIVAGQPQSVAPGVVQRTGPTGVVTTTNTQGAQGKLVDYDMKDLGEATDEAKAIQGNMTRLYEMRDLIKQLPQMGSGGEFRARVANMVETYIKPIPGMGGAVSDFLHSAADLPDAEVAQKFAKLTLQAAGTQEKGTVGARGSLGLTKLFVQANPNIDMQQNAAKDIANLQLVQHQMELDYIRGLHDHVVGNVQQYSNGQGNYVPAAEYDKKWVAADNNKVYFAATQALNGKQFGDWTKLIGNDPEKIKAAIDVVRRVDPTAQIMWQDGKPHVFAQGGG